MALEKTLYTARATTTGGRAEGKSKSSDGNLDVTLNQPTELGGNGKGTNPEQLFAAGYSACFMGAIKFVAGQKKIAVPARRVDRRIRRFRSAGRRQAGLRHLRGDGHLVAGNRARAGPGTRRCGACRLPLFERDARQYRCHSERGVTLPRPLA